RPLLKALANSRPQPPVLLIDEIDRADEEFEAYLLEVLADFAITIPEIGTIKAERPPHVIITSNRTREVHDALKRRCLYHWIDYPTADRELEILRRRSPALADALAREVVAFVQRLRSADLTKVPGIAETIDRAAALTAPRAQRLEAEPAARTLRARHPGPHGRTAARGGAPARRRAQGRAARSARFTTPRSICSGDAARSWAARQRLCRGYGRCSPHEAMCASDRMRRRVWRWWRPWMRRLYASWRVARSGCARRTSPT